MWFEGEDELEDGEAIVPMNDMIKQPINDMIKSKFDPDYEQINKILEKRGKDQLPGSLCSIKNYNPLRAA